MDLLKLLKENLLVFIRSLKKIRRTRICQKKKHYIAIGRLIKKLAEKLGIDIKKAHPHSLRYNFAIRYLRIFGQSALK